MDALDLETDCVRRLRVGDSGSEGGGGGVPKIKAEKVTGDLGELGELLLSLSENVSQVTEGEESRERNCSWLLARTSLTLVAQSSRPYSLCSSNLNVNG